MMASSSTTRLHGKRSFTGRHNLLPAVKPIVPLIDEAEDTVGLFFTFGRGSVIWKIWPAVLFYTVFSTVIVVLEEKARLRSLAIPNVMLTVLGVVIGFVISYRAMSGYDRYWMGRTAWSDVIRNSRTISRLVWYHVPPTLSSKSDSEIASGKRDRSSEELMKVTAEKRMALDLIGGLFAVALKHHIRGEEGIYFEDLYHLVRPLHDHEHTVEQNNTAISSALSVPSQARRVASNPALLRPLPSPTSTASKGKLAQHGEASASAYGTFSSSSPRGSARHSLRRASSNSSLSTSVHSEHQILHPSQNPDAHKKITQVDPGLVPFSGVFHNVKEWLKGLFKSSSSTETVGEDGWRDPYGFDSSQRKWSGPVQPRFGKAKRRRPRSETRGENLPLEILRCLSEWFSVLEDRNTVPGTSLGSLIGCIAAMEDSLVTLERILTTPLPFVYAVHIRTVWIYLFFLPFQLIDQFVWYTIPGTAIAAFIYLGFLAAGEEIEQPFGYDDNDLDLDLFVSSIIMVDIENLKRTPCLNAHLPESHKHSHQRSTTTTLVEAAEVAAPTAEVTTPGAHESDLTKGQA